MAAGDQGVQGVWRIPQADRTGLAGSLTSELPPESCLTRLAGLGRRGGRRAHVQAARGHGGRILEDTGGVSSGGPWC